MTFQRSRLFAILACLCPSSVAVADLSLSFSDPTITLNAGASTSPLTISVSYTSPGNSLIAGYSLGFWIKGGPGSTGTLSFGSLAIPADPVFSSYLGDVLYESGNNTGPLSDPYFVTGTSGMTPADRDMSVPPTTRNAATFDLTASGDAAGTFSLYALRFQDSNYTYVTGNPTFDNFAFSNASSDDLLLSTITVNQTAAIPEPSVVVLCGIGLVGGAVARWRPPRVRVSRNLPATKVG